MVANQVIITLSPPPVRRHSLKVSWNPHIQIFLQHSICPVLVHFCRVKLVFSLMNEAQMSGQAALVVLNPNNIATSPTQSALLQILVERERSLPTCMSPSYFPPQKTARLSPSVSPADSQSSWLASLVASQTLCSLQHLELELEEEEEGDGSGEGWIFSAQFYPGSCHY